jgi:DNA-binding response OmpR family regulator
MARILIAEDEPDILELITFTLQYASYEVIASGNGEDALRIAREELPDLVLLDVRMPRLSGYEVCQQLKSDEATRNIPVVFLSAKGQDAEVSTGLEAGAEEYLLKPFAPEQLITKIRAILEVANRAGDRAAVSARASSDLR